MSEHLDPHVPRPAFRSRLEDDVLRTFNRESRFAVERRAITGRRLRTLSLVGLGLVMGFATEFASGQVQSGQERSRLLEVAQSERQMAALRLRLTEEEFTSTRQLTDLGVKGQQSLRSAEAAVRRMRLRLARIDSEIAEIKATSAPPRDELWAPLVGDRDFVTDRLQIDAADTQEELRLAEARLEDLQRSQRVGIVSSAATGEARMELANAQASFMQVARKLELRKRFFDENLTADQVTRALQRFDLMTEIERTMRAINVAEERLNLVRQQARIGVVTELDARRAELDALELKAALERLRTQLRELDSGRGGAG